MRQGAQGWCPDDPERWDGEGGSGWATHAHTWLIHVNVWQKPSQYCKVISLQLVKINGKKKIKKTKSNLKKRYLAKSGDPFV